MTLARQNVVLLYRDGVSQADIARQAGVSKQRVNQIVTSFKGDLLRRRHLELLQRSRANRGTFVDSLEAFDSSREAYRETLRLFDANYEAYRRLFKSIRKDQEARRRDGHIRAAYLRAHPRARRSVGTATRAPEAPPTSRPALRLVQ